MTPADVVLIEGDCLHALRAGAVGPGAVDLCYLDPPFFSRRDHGAFDDRWAWGPAAEADLAAARDLAGADFVDRVAALRCAAAHPALGAYLAFLAARLSAVALALAPHGALFVHVDPTAGPYVRVLCDALLGRAAFVNEVVWRYRRWPVRQRAFQRMHDTLLFYAPAPGHPDRRFATQYEARSTSTRRRWGRHSIRASRGPDGARAPSAADPGAPASPGAPLSDVWDLPILAPSSRERTGWPTQKPEALLSRVVAVTTRPGDLVLDPFCGSGTTLAAAVALGRRAVGIDVSPAALAIARERVRRGDGAQEPAQDREGTGARARARTGRPP